MEETITNAHEDPGDGRTLLAETRRRAIAEALRAAGSIAVADVQSRFGVSPMTARRDLDELERRGVLRRTHGGAVLPTTSAHEDSFARRLRVETEAKERLAAAAVGAAGAARDGVPRLLDHELLRGPRRSSRAGSPSRCSRTACR